MTETKNESRGFRPRLLPLALAAGMLGAGWAAEAPAKEGFGEAPLQVEGSAAAEPWKRYGRWPQDDWSGYNTLAATDVTPPPPEEGAIREVAAPIEGDPELGRKLAFDRGRGGSCLACHVMGPKSAELPGNVGPDLSEIGAARDDEYLFNYVWDPRVYNPETVMPPWGAHGYYTEEEIRHIVAFLKTLTAPAEFANPLDDPWERPEPVEDRDWTDPFVNPAVDAIDQGIALFEEAGPSGQSCASCHAAPDEEFRTFGATMPRWEPRMEKVMGTPEFVMRHAAATTGAEYLMQSPENTALTVYLTSLSNGEPFAVDVESPNAKAAYERGAQLMETKIGQGNFACVDCHSAEKGANHWIRGQWLGESRGQVPHFPVWRTSRNEIWDIRKRFQWCNVSIRANDLPPDAAAYGELELWLNAQSNGLEMEAPGIRH